MACFISKMDYCAMCHVWVFLQASVSVLFMVIPSGENEKMIWEVHYYQIAGHFDEEK
jgi:hypothetical protein